MSNIKYLIFNMHIICEYLEISLYMCYYCCIGRKHEEHLNADIDKLIVFQATTKNFVGKDYSSKSAKLTAASD